MRFAASLIANLQLPEAGPAPHWLTPGVAAPPPRQSRKLVFVFAPAAVLLMIAAVAVWYFNRGAGASLEVARLSGQPVIESAPMARTARLHTGEWLETDGRSRALIQVGLLGQVEVDPRSRVRLVKTGRE